jgi:hypothetical protein
MTFTQVANTIIKESIISALYIDDKIVEPFEKKTAANSVYFEISKGLFESFRKENKSIDFYKFNPAKSWQNETEYIFKNRDLLVLDWQLEDIKELKQTTTLNILQKAIEANKLHFVSIYTETPKGRFEDIFYIIKAHFETEYSSKSQESYNNLIEALDNEGIETDFLADLSGKFKELSLNKKPLEALTSINDRVKAETGKHYGLFRKHLKSFSSKETKSWEILGYCSNGENFNENNEVEYDINYKFINKNFIVINHTIIQLTNKNNPKPDKYFNFFTNAVIEVCGNLLTLTSLEIKNLLRVSSGFIGKDADGIDEAALFYHQIQKDSFFEFILEIWKSHTLSFVDYNSDKLKTLNAPFWNQYRAEKKIDKKITSLQKKKKLFENELAKLNVYYNSLNLNKPDNSIIKFGDVFVELDAKQNPTKTYWLNVTAHCDCFTPEENIKNNFYFTRGVVQDIKESLLAGDGGFNSYLKISNDVISVKWNPRPIVLNIPNNKMAANIVETKDGISKERTFKYIGTLKESYAQRMANNSFAFAMRVGVDFAGIKKLTENG